MAAVATKSAMSILPNELAKSIADSNPRDKMHDAIVNAKHANMQAATG